MSLHDANGFIKTIHTLNWNKYSYDLEICNSNTAWDSLNWFFLRLYIFASTKNKDEATKRATLPIAPKMNDQPKKLLSWPTIHLLLFADVANIIIAIPPHIPPTNNIQDMMDTSWMNLHKNHTHCVTIVIFRYIFLFFKVFSSILNKGQ